MKTILLLVASLALASCSTQNNSKNPGKGWGKFVGPIRTEWKSRGREMELMEDVYYIGPDGYEWLAPKGDVIDGASIPRAFWTLIGGPYEGPYRFASVFHDVGCSRRFATWQDVHYMFYTAMRANGVPEKQAKIMYAGVYRFGPRWTVLNPKPLPGKPSISIPNIPTKQPTPSEVKEIQAFVAKDNPSLETIETTKELPGKSSPTN